MTAPGQTCQKQHVSSFVKKKKGSVNEKKKGLAVCVNPWLFVCFQSTFGACLGLLQFAEMYHRDWVVNKGGRGVCVRVCGGFVC